MVTWRTQNGKGWSFVEILAVTAVCALLLAMGFVLYSGMRDAARVCTAQARLGQISTGLELYFRKYGSYPPQGSDLTQELAPFVQNPAVFANPLMEERTPGETINALYREPPLSDIDSPDHYILAMVSDDRQTAVVLSTGNCITRHSDLDANPDVIPSDLLAMLDGPATTTVTIVTATDTVTYTIVRDSTSSVKYEDATTGLGEDGAVQEDAFEIKVRSAAGEVTVLTKASTTTEKTVVKIGEDDVGLAVDPDGNGFQTTLTGWTDLGDGTVEYTFTVKSVSNEHALSHVTFDFGDGAEVVNPDEGEVDVTRTTEESADSTTEEGVGLQIDGLSF